MIKDGWGDGVNRGLGLMVLSLTVMTFLLRVCGLAGASSAGRLPSLAVVLMGEVGESALFAEGIVKRADGRLIQSDGGS